MRRPLRSRKRTIITIIVIAIALVIFAVFRFLSPQSWPWGTIMISLPLWALALCFILIAYSIASFSKAQSAATNKDTSRSTEQSAAASASLERKPRKGTTSFRDVGGLGKAKDALQPVISWLEYPYGRILGVDIPRGVLLTGPSGSGKTLLVEALAGQTKIPLYCYSGAEFVEIWVGVGSSRIRKIFQEASKNSPCIVFIEQIDVIGSEHSDAAMDWGSASERYQTLVALLSELENLEANGQVYVVAATSRPRVLDPALTMPGRLSLRIDLQLPNKDERKEILAIHLHKKFPNFLVDLKEYPNFGIDVELHPEYVVDFERIALYTEGWSGSELEQLVYQAAECAVKRNEKIRLQPSTGQSSPSTHQTVRIICDADFVEAQKHMLPQPKRKEPVEIVQYLEKHVVGQIDARKRLAVAVSNHYQRLGAAREFEIIPGSLKKSNILLMGPTGSGKTLLVEKIADYLDVPHVIFNSTVLTETGMTGASVEQILYQLIVKADMNLRRAQYGIICIDEFDKLAYHQGERTRHTGAGVQQELLKITEGTIVDVPKTSGERRGGNSDYYQFDTRNILFVCLGAFIDIELIIDHRLHGATGTDDRSRKRLLRHVQPEDAIAYGFIPELIGRFPVITFTEELTVEELIAILKLPDGLVNEYKLLLGGQGWHDPHFTPEAEQRIAQEAYSRHVGARGLRGILEDVLLDTMYARPTSVQQTLSIDEQLVENALGSDRLSKTTILPPGELVQTLDKRLVGNQQAKQTLAIISHSHYHRLAEQARSLQAEAGDVKNQAVLLVDPYTGQRFQLVEELARILKVPCVTVNAEYLEQSLNARAGQRLTWLFDPLRDLLEKVNYNLKAAQQGIVFIDDFDRSLSKVTVHSPYSTLQQQLGEIIQGRSLFLPTGNGRDLEFKTGGLLFVLGGEFRFPGDTADPFEEDTEYLAKYQSDKILHNLIIDFGLSRDLLRYLIVVSLDLTYSKVDLEQIIRQEVEQIDSKYEDVLLYHDICLDRPPDFYRQLAQEAEQKRWKTVDILPHLESQLMNQIVTKIGEREHANERQMSDGIV